MSVKSSILSKSSLVEIPRDLSDSTTDLQVVDLDLLHHWTMFACHGFGDRLGDERSWQVDMPQIACKQPFLMRGILAMSALHMSRARPEERQKYLVRAVYHQNIALPSYRYVIDDFRNNMTEENCHAVIGFASLTSAYAFAEPHPFGGNRVAGVSSQTGVPEWLHLLRGARKILDVRKEWLVKGPMAFQVRSIHGAIDLSYNPEDHRLLSLEALFDRQGTSDTLLETEIDTYRTTLRLLRETCAIPLLPCLTLGVKLAMFRWVEQVPQMYLELLSQFRPRALILLAYFCVLLKTGAKHYWYMEGAAERIISALQDMLSEEWIPWIAWPIQEINDGIYA